MTQKTEPFSHCEKECQEFSQTRIVDLFAFCHRISAGIPIETLCLACLLMSKPCNGGDCKLSHMYVDWSTLHLTPFSTFCDPQFLPNPKTESTFAFTPGVKLEKLSREEQAAMGIPPMSLTPSKNSKMNVDHSQP